jgi:hypothetical protein
LDRFRNTPSCCLRPWFCRRIRKRLETQPDALADDAFWNMIDFWADDGEVVTTIRNERQHTRFNQALMSRKKSGARPKVIRVLSQSFAATLRDDHATLCRDAVSAKRKALRRSKACMKKQPRVLLKRAATELRRRNRRLVTLFSLGTGRTPKLHFINMKGKAAKIAFVQEQEGVGKRRKMPKTRFDELRAQFAVEWAAMSEAERQPYTLAVKKAREDRIIESRPLALSKQLLRPGAFWQ